VQGTKGAELVEELEIERVDKVIGKGMKKEVEMYSAFYDPLVKPRCCDSGLAGTLKGEGITDVFVVGLAFDYCVNATAADARKEGFRTVVVGEGTKAVDEGAWEGVAGELGSLGVRLVSIEGEEVGWVRRLNS
jgi:nicotinamidase-related amidase